ncbi:hypothetical protein [Paracoccus albicereus]|nr:hypothetical protein [Paracoccus albicereus]
MSGSSAVAQDGLGQAWVEAMNACEMLISDQSFSGFQGYTNSQSILNVEPRLERGFRHPEFEVNASAISDGSEWFFCQVTGETEANQFSTLGTIIGTLAGQITKHGDYSLMFEDEKYFPPGRIICRGGGKLTLVFTHYGEGKGLRVAATNMLPNGGISPCK